VRGAAAGVVAAVLSVGCAHVRLHDGPGEVDLGRPPPALAARGATLPARTIDRAVVVSPGVLAGLGAREVGDGDMHGAASLGFELGVHATHVKMSELAKGGSRDFGFPDVAGWGVNFGWTPYQTRTPAQRSHQPSMYLEGQWRKELVGLAAGVAFTPEDSRRERTGFQVTPLAGPFYGRLQVLLDGNVALEFGLAVKIPVVFSWGP
jgi:hypothetical protein